MNILITGGAGYIGTALCHELSSMTGIDKIVVYDNLSRPNYNLFIGKQKLDPRFEFFEGDILDSRKLRRAIKKADVVFHLAAKVTTPFADQDAHLFEQVNHWGTAELSYAIEESSVKKVIYTSSVSVYGAGDDSKTLSSNLHPSTFYGISKLRGEEHIARLAEKCETYLLRCGNVYGYNRSMRFDAVINKLMFEAHFQKKINIHGSGNQRRPFIHIAAAAKALAGTLHSDSKAGTHNLVEDNFQVNEVVEVMQELYPDMEIIFINHNMQMKELVVNTESNVIKEEALKRLKNRLLDFKNQFTF